MTPQSDPGLSLEARLESPTGSFVPNLDFMRSVAVLLVVVAHNTLILNHPVVGRFDIGFFGKIGVWMFFVHTSLVLMWSLERRPYTIDFYIRRIFRVYPVAIVATLAVVLTHAPLSIGSIPYLTAFPVTAKNLIANLLLLFNLGHPEEGFRALLHVEWTLPWEIQMYLLLPALFAFARRERTIWTLLLFWGLTVQILRYYRIFDLSFANSIPDFLAGVIAFVGFKKVPQKIPAFLFPIFLLALIASLWLHSTMRTGSWLFTLTLGLTLPLFRSFKESFFTKACNDIARYSFGIYLSHPFAIWIAFGLLGGHSLGITFAIEITVIVILSVLSFHFIEKPMIDIGSRVAEKAEIYVLKRDGGAERKSL